jgi:hypothetical protein
VILRRIANKTQRFKLRALLFGLDQQNGTTEMAQLICLDSVLHMRSPEFLDDAAVEALPALEEIKNYFESGDADPSDARYVCDTLNLALSRVRTSAIHS